MNIKKLRTQLNLTQVQFAELLGTTQMTVSTWENGKCPQYIESLAELALSIPISISQGKVSLSEARCNES